MGGGKKRPYSVLGLQLDRGVNAVVGDFALNYATAGSSRLQAPELKNTRRSVVKNRRLFLSRDVGFALIGSYQQCFVQPDIISWLAELEFIVLPSLFTPLAETRPCDAE
jgi:hypothetical protein